MNPTLRRLAAAAPPAGPSATVLAGNAPAVPEATPDDAPLDGEALALAEHFRHLDCGQVVDPVDLEDCGNMAVEVIRFMRAAGWVPLADVLDALRDWKAFSAWYERRWGEPPYGSPSMGAAAPYLAERFAPTAPEDRT